MTYLVRSTLLVLTLLTGLFSLQVAADETSADAQAAPALAEVNINTADAAQLSEMLTGVGPARAAAIVSYRQENGRFDSVDELLQVSGVGDATLEANRHVLTTGME